MDAIEVLWPGPGSLEETFACPSVDRFIEVHRLGTFPERSLDIDVVYDVMIHDLDILLALVGAPVVDLMAALTKSLEQRPTAPMKKPPVRAIAIVKNGKKAAKKVAS